MDRYQKVEKPKPELPINENEIRITAQGLVRNYISYATTLLQEKHGREIVLKGMGQAISKTVAIAEIIKCKADAPRLNDFNYLVYEAAKQELSRVNFMSKSYVSVWEATKFGLNRSTLEFAWFRRSGNPSLNSCFN
ncbi:ribonuclease P [Sarracenia purpurea var. burkii]